MGQAEAITALLDADADPNLKDINGQTPLHFAAEKGHALAMAVLLGAGAEPNVKDNNGLTPADVERTLFW